MYCGIWKKCSGQKRQGKREGIQTGFICYRNWKSGLALSSTGKFIVENDEHYKLRVSSLSQQTILIGKMAQIANFYVITFIFQSFECDRKLRCRDWCLVAQWLMLPSCRTVDAFTLQFAFKFIYLWFSVADKTENVETIDLLLRRMVQRKILFTYHHHNNDSFSVLFCSVQFSSCCVRCTNFSSPTV